ncbi:MAG: integrase [Cognaticolwellia sp.]|jgi:integrase
MSLVRVLITDKSISSHVALPGVSVLRDEQNPLLQLRYKKNRAFGVWRILFRNKWHKVGEWPETKTRDIRNGFSNLISKIRNHQEAAAIKDCFNHVGDLIVWYGERKEDESELSEQRKKDIKSAIKCHLLPRLNGCSFDELTHAFLDRKIIWPLQKHLAKSTVAKLFRTLKAAFSDAAKQHLIENNPLAGIKITDFGDFMYRNKGTQLQPFMVAALLDELQDQKVMTKVIVMLMLALGNRIGETRTAKWSHMGVGANAVWVIPEECTKTHNSHTIHLPGDVVQLLNAWKKYQLSKGYKGKFLFPHVNNKECISANEASSLIHEFSGGEWASHDLRKCARISWANQKVDFMVAERMLNHSLGKVAEAYLDTTVEDLRLAALEKHCEWLKSNKSDCFILNPESTPSGLVINSKASNDAA